jgi:hypothetical protein
MSNSPGLAQQLLSSALGACAPLSFPSGGRSLARGWAALFVGRLSLARACLCLGRAWTALFVGCLCLAWVCVWWVLVLAGFRGVDGGAFFLGSSLRPVAGPFFWRAGRRANEAGPTSTQHNLFRCRARGLWRRRAARPAASPSADRASHLPPCAHRSRPPA